MKGGISLLFGGLGGLRPFFIEKSDLGAGIGLGFGKYGIHFGCPGDGGERLPIGPFRLHGFESGGGNGGGGKRPKSSSGPVLLVLSSLLLPSLSLRLALYFFKASNLALMFLSSPCCSNLLSCFSVS